MGRVFDDSSEEPLSYVNIGLKGKNIGTVSDRNGFFKLTVPSSLRSDTLFFSSVGYLEEGLSISDISFDEELEVRLSQEVIQLDDFVVMADGKRKYKTYGDRKKTNIRMHTPKFYKGAQIARRISLKDYPAALASVQIGIYINDVDSLFVRVRVFDINERSGEPGEELLKRNVVENIGRKTGFVKIDLQDQGVMIEGDFFISIEFLDVSLKSKSNNFTIYARQSKPSGLKRVQFIRFGSYGDWVPRKERGITSLVYALGATISY
ncbi:carboxypeptidase-like regulatory domain-containing protein [Fabibacter sp. E12]|nr:carboxypeptidase-like regulatory domain-containing protein [Roseivirga sp. E12]